jgi:uncharacterized membrane protein
MMEILWNIIGMLASLSLIGFVVVTTYSIWRTTR